MTFDLCDTQNPWLVYFAHPIVPPCDNDGGDDASAEAEAAETKAEDQDAGKQAAEEEPKSKSFSQDDLNRIVEERLSKDRRRREQQYKDLESKYEQLLQNQNLTEDERNKLEETLEDVRKQLRTKEQRAAHERKQMEEKYQKELTGARQAAEVWEKRYMDSLVSRALQDAAVGHDAFNPSQVVTLLRGHTKVVDQTNDDGSKTGEHTAMVDLQDVDTETGQPIVTQRTPDDAVKRMKELPQLYGNLFKTNVVSGVGGNSVTGGLQPGASGQLSPRQIAEMPMEQYKKIRAENPELLGLSRASR